MACLDKKTREKLEKEARQKLGIRVTYGHCLEPNVIQNAVEELELPSFINLYQQLSAGVHVDNGTKKYWFDKKTKSNGYFLYARALTISWIENSQYWKWTFAEHHGKQVEVAELIRVSLLDVRVKIQAYTLSPGITYEIVFDLLIKNHASGLEEPVLFGLKKPNSVSTLTNKEILDNYPRGEWVEIKVGNLKVDDTAGEIEISMWQHEGKWKSGLVIRGVKIQAKPPGCGCRSG